MSVPPIIIDDETVPATEASLALTSPGFAYAACVFEGICVYKSRVDGAALIFRLDDHLRRLMASMRAVGFAAPPSLETLRSRVLKAVSAAGITEDAHLRLMAYVDGDTRIDETGPVRTAVLTRMAGERPSQRPGFHCRVSSWRRPPDASLPSRVKCTANYAIGRMATLEAKASGADAPILLSNDGAVAEGATANLFMLRGGRLVTPRTCDGILEGITRDSVIGLWQEVTGAPVIERRIDRSEFNDCEAAFFCGSLWEISPILSVDGVALTATHPDIERLKARYAAATRGDDGGRGWCLTAR